MDFEMERLINLKPFPIIFRNSESEDPEQVLTCVEMGALSSVEHIMPDSLVLVKRLSDEREFRARYILEDGYGDSLRLESDLLVEHDYRTLGGWRAKVIRKVEVQVQKGGSDIYIVAQRSGTHREFMCIHTVRGDLLGPLGSGFDIERDVKLARMIEPWKD